MLGTGQVKKDFSPKVLIYLKTGNKHETCFTNVHFRRNSACVIINKWLRFKRVITVRLACFSHILANRSKII